MTDRDDGDSTSAERGERRRDRFDDSFPSRDEHEPVDAVDPEGVLDAVTSLDVRTWRTVAGDASDVHRLGPTAEAFRDLLDVAVDADSVDADSVGPNTVYSGDVDSVALAAVQGTVDRLDEQSARIDRQARQIDHLRETVDAQRDDVESLRERLETLQGEVARLRRDADGPD